MQLSASRSWLCLLPALRTKRRSRSDGSRSAHNRATGHPFEGLVLVAALIAMLVGALVSLALSDGGRSSTFVALFGAAAGAFVVARFYGFDPYYLPTLRRYSDGGAFPPGLVYTVAGLGLLASLLCFARPRVGLILSGAVLFVCAFTSIFLGTGH